MSFAAGLVAAVGLCLAPAIQPSGGDPPTGDAIRGAVRAFFEAELRTSRLPGAAVAVVRRGETWLEGFGFADVARGIPVDPERSIFRVGSISKSITSTAALALIEGDRLDLHATVNGVLGEPLVPGGFDDDVTVFHLLTHTSGFEDVLAGQHAATRGEWTPPRRYVREHPPVRFLSPGRFIAYSDADTVLLGLVIESVTGQTFAEHVEASVFRPLGMTRSTFRQVDFPDEFREGLATSYRRVGERLEPYAPDYVNTTPAAGLFTTARDMAIYLRALLAPDAFPAASTVLSERGWRSQLERQVANAPELPGRALGFAETQARGRRALFKDGQASGFSARLYLVPEESFGFFVVSNVSILEPGWRFGPAAGVGRRLAAAVMALFPERPGSPASSSETSDGPGATDFGLPAERFAGHYRALLGSRRTIEIALLVPRDVRVRVVPDGDLEIDGARHVRVGPRVFRDVESGALAVFEIDGRGRASHLFVGTTAYERISLAEALRLSCAVLACGGTSLATFAGGIVLLARRARRGSRRGAWPVAVAAMASILTLASLAIGSFEIFGTDPQRWFEGPSPALRLAIAGGRAALALFVATLAAGVAQAIRLRSRCGLSVAVLAANGASLAALLAAIRVL